MRIQHFGGKYYEADLLCMDWMKFLQFTEDRQGLFPPISGRQSKESGTYIENRKDFLSFIVPIILFFGLFEQLLEEYEVYK